MSGKSGGGRDAKRLGVYLPRELHTWLKAKAALLETTMAAIVVEILWAYHAEVTQGEAEESSPSQIE